MTRQVHRRCWRCGRLLVPIDGHLPPHRIPPQPPPGTRPYNTRSVPLTGLDRPYCAAGEWT